MKRAEAKTKRAAKRDLFAELSEGMKALAEARHGKRTLRLMRLSMSRHRYAAGIDHDTKPVEVLHKA